MLCGFLYEAMSLSLPVSNYYPGFTHPEEPAFLNLSPLYTLVSRVSIQERRFCF